jgi:putative aldouronate transport system permease protein
MLCKYCNAEIPKKATRCPECGRAVPKIKKNLYPIAIAGAVISFVGGFFPAIQSSNSALKFTPAYGFMNYDKPALWYLFMALLVVSCLLCAFKIEKFSIITTVLAAVVYGITYSDIKSQYGGEGMGNGLATAIIIVGTIVGIVGCFLDVNKNAEAKKIKNGELDFQYTGNKTIAQRIYMYRGFYLMFLPVLIFVIIFNYLPMAGLRYAFTQYKSGTTPTYVGIKNFVDMFGLSDLSTMSHKAFLRAFGNTLRLSIIKLFLNTFMAVIISLLLNEMTNIIFKKTVQTIVYLPHFMSWVVVASIFKMFFSASDSGMLNSLLFSLGLIDKKIEFLTTPNLWTGVYYLVNVWKDTGWGTILFLATLSGISPDLYEAAQIDGANRFNRLRYITLPALNNTIITVFILNLAKVMNLFESVFVMYNDSVLDVSDVLQTYIYRQSFSSGTADYGYTTAVGLFKSLVSCALVLACNKASKKVRGRGIV